MNCKELIERLRRYADFGAKLTVCEDAATAIETLLAEREAAGWISANDRLPEQYELVLLAYEDGFVNTGYLDYPGTRVDFESSSVGLLKYFRCRTKEVTHWMPLPTPPDRQQTES